MADHQIKDLDDLGAAAVSGDMLAIYDLNASYDKRIDIDDFFTSLWALNQAFTLGAKLTAGAIEIEGSNFDINGGTSDDLVINSGSIGSTTPITRLDVDNIRIDLNTISSTSGGINIAPLAGQKLLLDGAVQIDAGVVTGITSITATTGVITTADLSTVTIEKTLAFDGSPQDLTGAGEINATASVTQISTGAGAAALTIANGTTEGQIKIIYMVGDGGGAATLTEAGSTYVFDDVNDGIALVWDNANSFWRPLLGATFTL